MARAVLLRILQIALGLSFFLMAGLYLGRSFVPRVFTADPAVIAIAERVFPILAAFIVSTLKSVWRHLMIPLQVRRVCWLDQGMTHHAMPTMLMLHSTLIAR